MGRLGARGGTSAGATAPAPRPWKRVASAVSIAALAGLSTAVAGADTGRTAPRSTATGVTGPRLNSIAPEEGPVGTAVSVRGECPGLRSAPLLVQLNLLSALPDIVNNPGSFPIYLNQIPAPRQTGEHYEFTGTFTIPTAVSTRLDSTQLHPTPPGMYNVLGWCLTGAGVAAGGFIPFLSTSFCVTPSPRCDEELVRRFSGLGINAALVGAIVRALGAPFVPSTATPPGATTTTTRAGGTGGSGGPTPGGPTPGGPTPGGPTPGGQVDTVNPTVDVGVSPNLIGDASCSSDSTAVVSWNASDNVGIASVTVSWSGAGGSGTSTGGASDSVSIGPFPDNNSTVSITAVATDTAGNTGTAGTSLSVQCPP